MKSPLALDLITPARAKTAVDSQLEHFFALQLEAAQKLDQRYAKLWQVAAELTLAGGKRLRPYLVLLAYESVARAPAPKEALDVAVAHELLHASLLMHDDIIDQDLQRYGRPNVAGVFTHDYRSHTDEKTANHYGAGAALLAGDLVLTAASQVIAQSAVTPSIKQSLLHLLNEAVFTVAAGELLDMESSMANLSTSNPLKIAAQKTAHYSFVVPLLSGATLAGADENIQSKLRLFGSNLGVAYQLADDLLGVFGNESDTGKSNVSDLREGKTTYLMQVAWQRADVAQTQQLQALIGNPELDNDGATLVRGILHDTGAVAETKQTIAEYGERAQMALNNLDVSPEGLAALNNLISKAIIRNK